MNYLDLTVLTTLALSYPVKPFVSKPKSNSTASTRSLLSFSFIKRAFASETVPGFQERARDKGKKKFHPYSINKLSI